MADVSLNDMSAEALNQMHALYCKGGRKRNMAPHVIYSESNCPHVSCDQRMQAIDFRLEDYGQGVHDPLVKAWWDDTGFAGQCPKCSGWIHFTIQDKRAVSSAEAQQLPQLPADWFTKATVL